eukprot:5162347-Ditylum_brightwellii.AAC.1
MANNTPPVPESAKTDFCLHYHLVHSCHDWCRNIANHWALSNTECQTLLAWRNKWFPSPPSLAALQLPQQQAQYQQAAVSHQPPPTTPLYQPCPVYAPPPAFLQT